MVLPDDRSSVMPDWPFPRAEVPSAVVLSIEPAVVAPESGSEIPVILPGYVLPDDSLEESSHAGS